MNDNKNSDNILTFNVSAKKAEHVFDVCLAIAKEIDPKENFKLKNNYDFIDDWIKIKFLNDDNLNKIIISNKFPNTKKSNKKKKYKEIKCLDNLKSDFDSDIIPYYRAFYKITS